MIYSAEMSRFTHHNTRNKMDLHPVKIKTKLYGEKTISFQGRNCWNKLPSDVKEINSVIFLRKNLNNILLATTKTKPNEVIIFQFLLQNKGLPNMFSKHIIFALFSHLTLIHLTLLRCSSFSLIVNNI